MTFPDSADPDDRAARYRPLLGFLLLTLFVGALGSVATEPAIPGWYAGLIKPGFNPPNWVFAPAWTALYILMAVAAFRVWRITGLRHACPFARSAQKGGRKGFNIEMIFWGAQLACNCAWSFLFFAAHWMAAALVEIGVLWLLVLATTILFWRRDRLAGLLFLPYLAWLGFAFWLNLMLLRLNT